MLLLKENLDTFKQMCKEFLVERLERERNEPPAEKKKKKKKNAGPSKTYTDILETTSTMRKIIPGTPVEGERNWVIGKYGRPLPIMHIPKVGSKKTVKVDPSKFCHCLRRLPDKDDDVVNVDSLTWSLDDNIIKIKKKKKKREHCEDENVEPEVNSTHENIEIEPIKKKKKKKRECNGDGDIELELDDISKDTARTKKKKKEKGNNENIDSSKTLEVTGSNDNLDIPADESEIKKKKKKKKKEDNDVDENILIEETSLLEETEMQLTKKKRKKEKKEENSMEIDEIELLEQKNELESSFPTMEDSIEESGSVNLIKNELIIPETLFEDQHDESCDSNVSDDEKDKSILSKSIVEQLLEKSAASASTQSCEEESKTSLGRSIVDQLSSLDENKSEKLIEKSIEDGEESESESDDDAEENLFDFEFEDIAGENKKAFLEKLMSNIEVRDDTNGIDDESSADSSSSDEESEDDKSLDVGLSSHPIEKEVSEDLTSTNVRTNLITEEDISTKQDESPQIEAEKEVKPKKAKKKEKDTEKDLKKSKIQNSNKQEKHALSEEKRQKSLEARNSQIQQNKGLVSKALKDVDSTTAPTNRIVFSDNDSDDGEDIPINITEMTETISKENVKETKTGGEKSEASKTEKPGTKQLFDDSDSEEEEDSDEEEIVVKPQFQGKEGEKLFKLQQKFGGDERFKLDERFAENDPEAEKKTESTGEGDGEGDGGEEDTEKEKEMNMSILEQVLGKPLTGEKKEREYVHQRYDPDNVDHEKFEVKDDSADGKDDDEGLPKKKKKTEAPKIELPEVSKETFFDVNESIKDLFGKGESASFSFFGGGDDQSNDNQADDEEAGEEEEQPVDEPMEEESSENKIKEPSWKKGLEEMHSKEKVDEPELVATEEKKEIFDKKYTFLYIPEDDERLEAGKRFKRTEGIEEVTNQWRALRKTLTEDYKKKHKDAVRRVRKMREKRFNRT